MKIQVQFIHSNFQSSFCLFCFDNFLSLATLLYLHVYTCLFNIWWICFLDIDEQLKDPIFFFPCYIWFCFISDRLSISSWLFFLDLQFWLKKLIHRFLRTFTIFSLYMPLIALVIWNHVSNFDAFSISSCSLTLI